MNAFGFSTTNAPLQARAPFYPYSHSYMSNLPFQARTPFYSGAHDMHPLAPPCYGINQGLFFPTSPSIAQSESKRVVVGSSSSVGVGFGDLQGSPSDSNKYLHSKVLDLSLKL